MGAGEWDIRPRREGLKQRLGTIAQRHEVTPSQAALNWLLRKDTHVIPISGVTSADRAREDADALTRDMSEQEVAVKPFKCSTLM